MTSPNPFLDRAIRDSARAGVRQYVHDAERLMEASLRCADVAIEHREQLPVEFLHWLARWQIFLGLCALQLAYNTRDI